MQITIINDVRVCRLCSNISCASKYSVFVFAGVGHDWIYVWFIPFYITNRSSVSIGFVCARGISLIGGLFIFIAIIHLSHIKYSSLVYI